MAPSQATLTLWLKGTAQLAGVLFGLAYAAPLARASSRREPDLFLAFTAAQVL